MPNMRDWNGPGFLLDACMPHQLTSISKTSFTKSAMTPPVQVTIRHFNCMNISPIQGDRMISTFKAYQLWSDSLPRVARLTCTNWEFIQRGPFYIDGTQDAGPDNGSGFCIHERMEEGGTGYLPNARNQPTASHCGKSKTSFPHWPPSTYEEAVEQLQCLIGESFPHLISLANCWIIPFEALSCSLLSLLSLLFLPYV